MIERQRLAVEHVDRGAGDRSLGERFDQRRLVDDRPARRVDEVRGRLHRAQRFGADEPACFARQRHVQRDDVGLGEQLRERGRMRDAELGRAFLGQASAPADHVHVERATDGGHELADVADADDAERRPAQTVPDAALPAAAGMELGILARDVAYGRENQRPRELACRAGPAARPAYGHAALGGGGEIDRRIAHAGRHEQSKLGQRREQRAVERRSLAHRDDDLERRERLDKLRAIVDVIVQHGNIDAIGDRLPIGHRQRDALVIIEDRAVQRRGKVHNGLFGG